MRELHALLYVIAMPFGNSDYLASQPSQSYFTVHNASRQWQLLHRRKTCDVDCCSCRQRFARPLGVEHYSHFGYELAQTVVVPNIDPMISDLLGYLLDVQLELLVHDHDRVDDFEHSVLFAVEVRYY